MDLVVTAERAHRAPVLALRPDLLRKTFTFLELVQLAEASRPRLAAGRDVDGLRAVVLERGRHPVVDADLPDPVDAGPEEHARMVATVLAGTDRLLASLTAGAHARGLRGSPATQGRDEPGDPAPLLRRPRRPGCCRTPGRRRRTRRRSRRCP